MLLAPVGGALAFDPGEMRRLERRSQRAHAEHQRLLDKAARHRERIIAQARAVRERTIAESRAAARRLRVQARAERRRLNERARTLRRRTTHMPRPTVVREAPRRAPTNAALEFSFEGSISGLDASSELSLELNLSQGGDGCDYDTDGFEEEDTHLVVPYIDEAIAEALEETTELEELIEEIPELEALIEEHPELEELIEETPELEELIEEIEVIEPEAIEEPEAIDEPEVLIEASPPPDTSAVNGDFERVEWEILARVNAIRAERGLSELSYDPRLQAGAVKHSAEMYKMNYFSHTSPIAEHAEFDQRIQKEGIGNFQSAGENLVMGPDSADLAERFVQLWMDSPGHRDNILGDDFRFSGVGVYGEGDRVYATQLFSQRVDRSFK